MTHKIAHVVGTRRSHVVDDYGREFHNVQVHWERADGSWTRTGFDDFFHPDRAWSILEFMVYRLDSMFERGIHLDESYIYDMYRKAVSASGPRRYYDFS